jgi:hypothetical protein
MMVNSHCSELFMINDQDFIDFTTGEGATIPYEAMQFNIIQLLLGFNDFACSILGGMITLWLFNIAMEAMAHL